MAALCLAAVGAWSAHAGWFDGGRKTATGDGLSLATWNLEWLMTPATQAEFERALPTPATAQP